MFINGKVWHEYLHLLRGINATVELHLDNQTNQEIDLINKDFCKNQIANISNQMRNYIDKCKIHLSDSYSAGLIDGARILLSKVCF